MKSRIPLVHGALDENGGGASSRTPTGRSVGRAVVAFVVFAATMALMAGPASANCPLLEEGADYGDHIDDPRFEQCFAGGPRVVSTSTVSTLTPEPSFDRVVAFGDSFGAGTGFHAANRNYTDRDCLRTDDSHAGQIADHLDADLQNLACFGAVTRSVPAQMANAEIPGTGEGTLITLSIGGNDVRAGTLVGPLGALAGPRDFDLVTAPLNWGEVVGLCLVVISCEEVRAFQPTNLALVGIRAQRVYENLLRQFPDATIKVMSYPELFQRSPRCHGVLGVGRDEADWLDENARLLNAELQDAVQGARARFGGDIELVSVAREFDDRGACRMSWNRYIHDATPLAFNTTIGINKAFHPNKKGYDAFYRALRDSL